MGLVDQWRAIERTLPENWADARLVLYVGDDAQLDRAAALLGPLNAGRTSTGLRFYTARRGSGPLPDLMARLLGRLDAEKIDGKLVLIGRGEAEPPPPAVARRSLADTWDAEVDALPPDWSDVYAELEVTSTDYLDRAALLVSPLNPARYGGRPGFRFRCARRFG